MTDYQYGKGKERFAVDAHKQEDELPVRVLSNIEKAPLSDIEMQRCIETKNLVEAFLPELLPFIKDLTSAKNIPGWRNITASRLKD